MSKYEKVNRSHCHCISMRRASNAITEYYDQALKVTGISVNQYSLLNNLSQLGVASTSELAERMNLDRSTLVRNLRPILERELVLDIAKKGTRNHQFRVSEKGEKVRELAGTLWEEAQSYIKSYLGLENIELFMSLLYKLQEL